MPGSSPIGTWIKPDVLDRLSQLLVHRGVPQYIRSDNGVEFTARSVQEWLQALQVETLYIELGSPWEKDYASPCTSCVESDTTLGQSCLDASFCRYILPPGNLGKAVSYAVQNVASSPGTHCHRPN